MKPPHARKPRPVPPGGQITDPLEMSKLVHGDKEPWELLGHPEHGDKHDINPTLQEWADARRRVQEDGPFRSGTVDEHISSYASVNAWRRRQHERLRFLLLGDYLAGQALEAALKLKLNHEGREWRNRSK
jgi:hypothetical protein